MPTTARILVLVQTEPCISAKYVETVCTAGIKEDGSWVRLYPIKKRLSFKEYRKYQWIECAIDPTDNPLDVRKESHKVDQDSIIPLGAPLSTAHEWGERRRYLLNGRIPIYTKKQEILEGAKNNSFSLCLFKPDSIVKFYASPESPDYTEEQLRIIKDFQSQGQLFSFDERPAGSVKFHKVPYSFHCKFIDAEGAASDLSVLDWEIFTRFRNGMKSFHHPEAAVEEVLRHYNNFIEKKDLYFVLGTRNNEHNVLRNSGNLTINPWSVISVMPFPNPSHMELDLGV